MDPQLNNILVTFGVDLFLFLLYVALFFCLRHKRGDEVLLNMNQDYHIHKHFLSADLKSHSDEPRTSTIVSDGPQGFRDIFDPKTTIDDVVPIVEATFEESERSSIKKKSELLKFELSNSIRLTD